MMEPMQREGYRLSPQQQSAWKSLTGYGAARCVIAAIGSLDRARLDEALGAVIADHEIFRTAFETVPGLDEPLQFVELPDVPALRWSVCQCGVERFEVHIEGSALAWDAGTAALFLKEAACHYAGIPLPLETVTQYADYAAWAREQLPGIEAQQIRELDLGRIGRALPAASEAELEQKWALLCREQFGSRIAVRIGGRDARMGRLAGLLDRWTAAEIEVGGRRIFDAARLPPVAFAFECRERVEAGGLTWELISFRRECEAFPLKLTVVSSGGGVWGELEYDRGRWSEAEAQLLLQRYEAFVRGGMKPGAGFWELGDRGRDLGAEFELQAAARAGQAALRCGGREWTYAELGRRARQVAGALRRSGAGAESRVGLWADRSMETVAGLLGIWGAGAAAVLLEPGGPASRLAEQQSVAGVRWLLGKGERGLDGAERICLDEQSRVWEQEPAGALGGCLAEQLAYVIFTSGSTGRAKGVCLTHGALSAYAESMRERLGAEAGAVWESVSTLAADLGYTSVLGALLGGGTLVVRTEEESVDWHKVGGSDYLKITPGHLEALLAGGPEAGRVLPRKGLLLGGEDWGWELWERVKELSPGLRVYNHYGPTETAVGVLMGEAKLREGGHPVLGEPLGHVRAYILDQRGEPAGECGELWIGGRSVARGYQGAASATAERFRPDPWSAEAGQRVYGTGDRVRRQADGRYEYLGRMDSQIKIRGTRVELGEVEAALRRHPAVAQAAVVAMPAGPRGQPQLAAWVVPDNANLPSLRDLRYWAGEHLPEAMIPSQLRWIGEFPLTANGKVDRAALATMELPTEKSEGTAPASGMESLLAGIWAGILKRKQIGVTDDLFGIGADSIMCIQVVARASQSGVHLTLRQVYEHPTIRDLARVATESASVGDPLPFHSSDAYVGPVPLTPIQQWFFDQDQFEPHHYNQAIVLQTAEPLERTALEAALRSVAMHHDAFRLRFILTLDGWQQMQAADPGPVPLEEIDLSDFAPDTAEQAAADHSARLEAGLDLEHGPLFRAAWFRCGLNQPERLLLIAHHLMIDGVSWTFILEDLQRAYLQTLRNTPVALSPRTSSYRLWAEYLAKMGPELLRAGRADEWLSGPRLNVERLPDRVSSTAAVVAQARTMCVVFSTEETSQLIGSICPAYNMYLQESVLALMIRSLAKWSGRKDILIDVESQGRIGPAGAPDVSRTTGWFTARFPLLFTAPDETNAGQWLAKTKETMRRAAPRALDYGVLRHMSGDERLADDFGAVPQPEVSFNFLGTVEHSFPPGSPFVSFRESANAVRAGSTKLQYRFDFNAYVVEGRLEVTLTFGPANEHPDTAEALCCGIRQALEEFAAHCGNAGEGVLTPSDFPAADLTERDLDRLLEEWSRDFS